MTAPDERVSDEALREIVSDPAQVSGESLRVPARTTIAIARELLVARRVIGTVEDVSAVREASARLCRCGSGAHPRHCEVHPRGYDAHCGRLRQGQEDEERARREALEEAIAVCERERAVQEHDYRGSVLAAHRASAVDACAQSLRALLAGEAAP